VLTTTIASYAYVQYNDDENIQSFIQAYNAATQTYVDWFATVSLPVYTGLSAPLLDWVAQGLYGIARTSLESQVAAALGPLNTVPLNQPGFPLNTYSFPVSVFYSLSDDAFQRIITWDFYKGDGKRFTMRWLKRRIMRFLIGVNGIDPQPSQSGFVIGVENTSAISTIVTSSSGNLTLTVTINQSKLSSLFALTPGILTIFKLAFLGGDLELPLQYSYALNIVTSPIASVAPTSISSPTTVSVPAVVSVTGGSGPFTYSWTFASGGAGITITSPSSASTTFSIATSTSASGIALCTITDYFDDVTTIMLPVSFTSISGLLNGFALNEIPLNFGSF
jgi:hypothetical protein